MLIRRIAVSASQYWLIGAAYWLCTPIRRIGRYMRRYAYRYWLVIPFVYTYSFFNAASQVLVERLCIEFVAA